MSDKLFEYHVLCDAKLALAIVAPNAEEATRRVQAALLESSRKGSDERIKLLPIELTGGAFAGTVCVTKQSEISVSKHQEIPGQDVAF